MFYDKPFSEIYFESWTSSACVCIQSSSTSFDTTISFLAQKLRGMKYFLLRQMNYFHCPRFLWLFSIRVTKKVKESNPFLFNFTSLFQDSLRLIPTWRRIWRWVTLPLIALILCDKYIVMKSKGTTNFAKH